METAASYQNGTRVGAGSPLGGAAALSAGKPATPVQAHLQRQRELLSELEGAATGLIDPLRTALSHDPREANAAASGGTEAIPAPGCDLEEALMNANSQIASTIDRLRQIRGAIRL